MLLKSVVFVLAILLGNYLGNFFLPWWGGALVALLCGFAMPIKAWLQGLLGGLAIALFWFIHLYLINSANQHLLLDKMSQIFSKMPLSLPMLSVLIGFLLGSLGALVGYYGRDLLMPLEGGSKRRRRR
jgi:hypothetical protein